jgi:ankyrin repeat protein
MGEHVTEEEAVEFASVLLNAGARMDVRDDILKSTALGWACRWGRAGVAKVMLEGGATPVEVDAEPWAQPRAWAEKMGHNRVLTLLREYGV